MSLPQTTEYVAPQPITDSSRSHRGWVAPLWRTILRWVVAPIATVLAASFVVFTALTNAPGDPVAQRLGSHATAEQVAALRHELGLDHSLLPRYGHWLAAAVRGDFGTSITFRAPVESLLASRITTTLMLVAFAALIAMIIGIALGIVAAMVRPAGPLVAVVAAVAVAIPGFVAAQLLIGLFALKLGWFPAGGTGQGGFADMLVHLTLPAVALALSWMAYLTQVTRSALAAELSREHVATATLRGLPPGRIFSHHVARNAAPPVLMVSGLTVAGLIVGAVVVESAFGIDGLGSLLVSAIQAKDYNVVQAISMAIVVVFVAMTLFLDIIERSLDPRLRKTVTR